MKRRDFVTGALTGAAVGAGAVILTKKTTLNPGTPQDPGNSPNVGGKFHEWKMVTTWPKNFPGLGTGAQRLADLISSMSNERLNIKLYAAGELVPAFETFDAVREGTAECGHAASYYWVAKHKSTPFFCALPGGLTYLEHTGWIQHGGGQKLWDELYSEFGMRAFLAGGTGAQMGGWFKNEIKSLDDFQGLKFRIPGLGAEVVNRMGATAVNTPGGEIMSALQSGVIDGAEWIGPWNDLAFGFHKAALHYYGPGFQEGGTAAELMINSKAWETLPKDLQDIVHAASLALTSSMPSEYFARNAGSLPVLLDDHGVQLHTFPEEVVSAMYRISNEVVAETASESELSRRIYENWSNYRRLAIAYQPYSILGFSRDRGKNLA